MKPVDIKNIAALVTENHSAWFRHWFDSTFYHQLYANRSETEAAGFIDALIGELQPADHAAMLDLGCGAGRHAKYLASKGFTVTGLDLALSSIRQAKKAETQDLRFYRHDMRNPFGSNSFDYVFNFFTSFGYFKTEQENHAVMHNIFDALKPGAVLVMDYINTPYAEQRLVAQEKKEIDGVQYHISRWTDARFFYKEIIIDNIQQGEPFTYVEQVEKFNLCDFDYLFRRNGLRLKKVYGNYQLGAYDRDRSPRLIMMAMKS